MNEYQNAKLQMVNELIQVCNKYSNVVVSVIPFQAALTALKAKAAEIEDDEELNSLSMAGITADRQNFEEIVCQIATDIAGIIYAYAVNTSNNALRLEVNLLLIKLRNKTDAELIQACRAIYTRAAGLKTELAGYGVSAEMLTDLQEAIDDYETASPDPHTALDKSRKELLKQLFEELDDILSKRMDNLMDKFRLPNPEFYGAYFDLRKNYEPSTTTRLEDIVTDEVGANSTKSAT